MCSAQRAKAEFREVLRLDPNNKIAINSLASVSYIEHGIANLDKTLEIDPQYNDAMVYMNLLIRERADLRDTPEDYRRDVEQADQGVQKALDTKRVKVQSAIPQRQ